MSVQLSADQEIVRNTLRHWIRDICEKKNYKPTNLARESKVSASTVLRLLNDETYEFTPSMTTLQKISSATGYALPESLINSKAPFAIYHGAQPGRRSNADKAEPVQGGDAEDVVATNIERLKGISELGAATDREAAMLPTGAGKTKAFADAVLSKRAGASKDTPVEPARETREVTPRSSDERMIPLYSTSAFPSSFTGRRAEAKNPVTECPEALLDDPTAFAVKIGDSSMGPVLKPGSLAFGSRYRDPAAGDLVYVRRTDTRSFVRSCVDINENGVVLHDAKGGEVLVPFDDLEDIGVIGIVEMVGFF